jgi:hypothetical protein
MSELPQEMDLKTFARFIRERKPELLRVLTGAGGTKTVWDGLTDLVKEIGYPRKLKKTDNVAETLAALMPYVEAYEIVDSGEPTGDEQAIQLL